MRKYLASIIIILILMVPIAGASNILYINNNKKVALNNFSNQDFTHTVFVEEGTWTGCPYCVTAANQLYNIYNSGDLNFYYAALIYDNKDTRNRIKELNISEYPNVFFDGKYKHILGGQSSETSYRNAINSSGKRIVPDIDIDMSVEWKGGGTIKITINVQNHEAEKYNGHLRVYVTEKVSRWNDNSGKPYHFGILDIPIDKDLFVVARDRPRPLADTKTFVKTWYGAMHGFGDITQDNIIVIASLFDADTDYVVETAAKEPVSYTHNLFLPSIIEKLINHFSILF